MDYVIAIELLQSSFPTHFKLPNNQIIHFNCSLNSFIFPFRLTSKTSHNTPQCRRTQASWTPRPEASKPHTKRITPTSTHPRSSQVNLAVCFPFPTSTCLFSKSNPLHLLHEHSLFSKPFPSLFPTICSTSANLGTCRFIRRHHDCEIVNGEEDG
jgi:hypothetical protein